MSAIDVVGLTKKFGRFTAVDNLSFSVASGRITGFLGPNGSGKTTTLRTALGLIKPSAGTVTINGMLYRDLPSPLTTVGAALEATNFHPARSGRNHLRVLAATHGIDDRRVDELLDMVGIPAFARKRAGTYSMGMRQRLALAAALLGDPEILILDEPANGLDPEGIHWLRVFLQYLAHDLGKTILVSSHILSEVDNTVDDIVIIANGALVAEGPIDELRGDAHCVVRSSDPQVLSAALAAQGIACQWGEDNTITASGCELSTVGDIALAAGVAIWELRAQKADLEDLFLRLTEGHNRNTEVAA